jgi:hypothetical protein
MFRTADILTGRYEVCDIEKHCVRKQRMVFLLKGQQVENCPLSRVADT